VSSGRSKCAAKVRVFGTGTDLAEGIDAVRDAGRGTVQGEEQVGTRCRWRWVQVPVAPLMHCSHPHSKPAPCPYPPLALLSPAGKGGHPRYYRDPHFEASPSSQSHARWLKGSKCYIPRSIPLPTGPLLLAH
jgi:hypothetical protein